MLRLLKKRQLMFALMALISLSSLSSLTHSRGLFMSMSATFFVTTLSEAKALTSVEAIKVEKQYQAFNVTELEVGYLLQAFDKAEMGFDESLGFEMIHLFNDDEAFTTKLPDRLLNLLVTLDEANVAELAEIWAASEIGWSLEECKSAISELKRLALLAHENNESIFMLNEL